MTRLDTPTDHVRRIYVQLAATLLPTYAWRLVPISGPTEGHAGVMVMELEASADGPLGSGRDIRVTITVQGDWA